MTDKTTIQVEDLVIFLSGPMRGYPALNHAAFHSYEEWLTSVGLTVISPAAHDHEVGIHPEDEDFDVNGDVFGNENIITLMQWCLDQVLNKATFVVLIPGWEQSKGALAEVATARAIGVPVFEADRANNRLVLMDDPVTVKLSEKSSPVVMSFEEES